MLGEARLLLAKFGFALVVVLLCAETSGLVEFARLKEFTYSRQMMSEDMLEPSLIVTFFSLKFFFFSEPNGFVSVNGC